MSALSLAAARAAVPWLDVDSCGAGADRRLIRLTSGPLAGAYGVAVWNDDRESEAVYTEEDWAAECAPSYVFDFDGDLVEATPSGGPSTRTVTFESIELTIPLTVEAGNARPTTLEVEGGVDVDVRITLDGVEATGEVTLLPAEDGRPLYTAWGSPDHWVESGLLAALCAAYPDHDDLLDALTEVEAAASRVAGQP